MNQKQNLQWLKITVIVKWAFILITAATIITVNVITIKRKNSDITIALEVEVNGIWGGTRGLVVYTNNSGSIGPRTMEHLVAYCLRTMEQLSP